jgi:hypothetical protein
MCVVHLGGYLGPGRLRALSSAVMADLDGGERRSTGFGPLEGLQTTLTGQKKKRGRRYSYRVLGQRGVVEEGVAGEVERSRPVGGGDAVEDGRFPASWSHRLTPGDAAKVPRVRGGSGVAGGEEFGLRATHPRG